MSFDTEKRFELVLHISNYERNYQEPRTREMKQMK